MKSLKCHADRTSNDLEAFEVLSEILERPVFSETKKRANFVMMELKDIPIETDGWKDEIRCTVPLIILQNTFHFKMFRFFESEPAYHIIPGDYCIVFLFINLFDRREMGKWESRENKDREMGT